MRRTRFALTVVCAVAALGLLWPQRLESQRASRFDREIVNGREVVAGEALVKFRSPMPGAALARLAGEMSADEVRRVGRADAIHLRSRSVSTATLLARLRVRTDVEYAEPNFIIQIDARPNDQHFGQLWGLENTGQFINFFPGVAGADIDAVRAWDLTVGSTSDVVAVIDTGIDYNHPDLAANMWSAPSAFTVTVAGSPITCAVGTHGFNAITRTCNPMDDHHHGTHVAGTIGAVGGNGLGVAGVNWTTRLMGIKFVDSTGSGTMADAIAAIEFAIAAKQAFASTGAADIRVLSNSWGGPDFSQALLDQVIAASAADMLFVAGSGNDAFNNDLRPKYPASFDVPNVISVAATSNTDDLAWFSNYGAESVDLAAPGVDVYSTVTGGGYAYSSGTSMATPHVSGAAALVLSSCDLDTPALKETLLGTAETLPSLTGVTATGGRLQLHSAVRACLLPPDTPASLTARPADGEITLAWQAALGAMRYNVKRSLTPGGPYATIADDIIGAQYVDQSLVNGTRYHYVVSAENNLGESGDSNEASAVPNIPPDLVVSSLTGPSVAGAGTAITMSVTTVNQGNGQAEPSLTRLYLSVNTVLDAGDQALTDLAVPSLVPAGSSLASVSIEIPGETSTGRYYVIARADGDDALFESSETNNTRSRSLQVGPDLDVSSFTVPSSGAAGATIPVTDVVTNRGGSGAAPTTVAFFLSLDGSVGAGDVPLGGRAVPALAAGATNSGSTELTIPSTTPIGSYYVIALADGGNAVVETSETNNSYARSIKIGNDLIVSALTVAAGGSGLSFIATDTITNDGAAAAPSSVTRFYLSSNSTLEPHDPLLDGARVVPPLDPATSSAGNTTVTVPASTPAGTYYLIAKADADNALAETSESNNTRSKTIYVGSDLVVSLTTPAVGGAGAAIVVSDTTSNDGGGAATASVTRFYLSSNSSWDAADVLLNGTHAVPALAGATGHTATTAVTIPAGTGTGIHYVIAKADADDAVLESKETNNTNARSIAIGPNLDLSTFTVPAKGGAGLALAVSDTTINDGGGSAAATTTRFYLSVNTSLDASDPLIGSRTIAALTAGQASSAVTTLMIPPGTSTGSYSVIARADADNTVPETSETDNSYVRIVKIGPDLDVSTLTASASTVVAGAAVTVTDKIINSGAGQATATTTRFYLSSNTTLDATDVPLAGARPVPALAPAASSTGSTSVAIPAGTAAARYYILARADGEDSLVETSETNNVLPRSIQVTAAP